jgi:hypothetical protein
MTLQERALANPWGNSSDNSATNFESRRALHIVVGLSLNY